MANIKRPRPDTPLPKTDRFCDRLWWLMEINGDTCVRLGVFLGMNGANIGAYVREECNPGIKSLIRIAKHYHVSTDFLLGLTDEPAARWSE